MYRIFKKSIFVFIILMLVFSFSIKKTDALIGGGVSLGGGGGFGTAGLAGAIADAIWATFDVFLNDKMSSINDQIEDLSDPLSEDERQDLLDQFDQYLNATLTPAFQNSNTYQDLITDTGLNGTIYLMKY
jgi:hypothetical protein